jgi:hypothetical protein
VYAKCASVSGLRREQRQKVEAGDDEVARGVKRIYRHHKLKRLRSTAFRSNAHGQAQLEKQATTPLLEVIPLNLPLYKLQNQDSATYTRRPS